MKANKFRSAATAAILRRVPRRSANNDCADLWAEFTRLAAQDLSEFSDLRNGTNRQRNTYAIACREMEIGIGVFLDHWFPELVRVAGSIEARDKGLLEQYRAKLDALRTHRKALEDLATHASRTE